MDYICIDFEIAHELRRLPCYIDAVKVSDGQIVDRLRSFVKPAGGFSEACIRYHGITPETVEKAPSFKKVWPSFLDFMGDLPLLSYLPEVTDKVFMDAALLHYKMPAFPPRRWADVAAMARFADRVQDSPSMEDMASRFGIYYAPHERVEAYTLADMAIRFCESFGEPLFERFFSTSPLDDFSLAMLHYPPADSRLDGLFFDFCGNFQPEFTCFQLEVLVHTYGAMTPTFGGLDPTRRYIVHTPDRAGSLTSVPGRHHPPCSSMTSKSSFFQTLRTRLRLAPTTKNVIFTSWKMKSTSTVRSNSK